MMTIDQIMEMTRADSLLKTKDKRNELLLREWFGKDASTAGRVCWKGKSLLDETQDIAVVLSRISRPSSNIKTGRMIQIQILNYGKEFKDFNPMSKSICGDCQHRNKSCYVIWNKSIYSSWKRAMDLGELTLDQARKLCFDRSIRLGTAGDPAAVPSSVWLHLLGSIENKNCSDHTAYTHQWHKEQFQDLKAFCMASVDSIEQERLALALGWRVFRVGTFEARTTTADLYKGLNFDTETIQCPATRYDKSKCESCGLCSGFMGKVSNKRFKGIGVRLHGSSTGKYVEPPSIHDKRYEWARSQVDISF